MEMKEVQKNPIFTLDQVHAAIAKQAAAINHHFSEKHRAKEKIVALTLLNGGIVYTGLLMPQLNFTLYLDSLSVSRYRDNTQGGGLEWQAYPKIGLKGVHVLLLDDIFDQGITLQAVVDWCRMQGASSVTSAVLAWKQLDDANGQAVGVPDFYALRVPDKFVIGMGMDCAGKHRNLPGIYFIDE